MKTYQPHEQRVITEMLQLDEQTTKLGIFLKSETFGTLTDLNQELLRQQRVKQRELLSILNQRVMLFTPVERLDPQTEIVFPPHKLVPTEEDVDAFLSETPVEQGDTNQDKE